MWLIVFLAFGPSVSATTYYVDASTGSDGNTGLSGSPWKSIMKALSVAVSGDIINVAAGTYSNALTGEIFPLALKDGVTLQGPFADPVHGTPPTAIVAGTGTQSLFSTSTSLSNTTKVSYFKFTNNDTSFTDDIMDFASSGVDQLLVIDSNEFDGFLNVANAIYAHGNGSAAGGRFDATISNNLFQTYNRGIDLDDSGYSSPMTSMSPTISGNTFNNNNYGVQLTAFAGHQSAKYSPLITGNTFTGGQYAMYLSASGTSFSSAATLEFSPVISNNTISGTSNHAISLSFSDDYSVSGGPTINTSPQVTNNSITNAGGDGIRMRAFTYGNFPGAATYIHSPTITGNTINTVTGHGIMMSMSAEARANGTATMNPTISGNTISGTGQMGIYQSLSVSMTGSGTGTLSPVISNNTISNTGSNGIGVTWSLSGMSGNGTGTSNASLTGNHVNTTGGPGVHLSYRHANLVSLNGTTTVSNNVISGVSINSGLEVAGYINSNVAGNSNLTISGNSVTSSPDGLFLTMSGNGGPIGEAIVVDNNSVTGNTGQYGMWVKVRSDPNLTSHTIDITHNNISNNGTASTPATGLAVSVAGWAPGAVPTNPTLVSCNTITGNYGNGVLNGSFYQTAPPPDFGGGNRGSVGSNNIYGNSVTPGFYDFYNQINSSTTVTKAQKNYWGTTTTATIDAHIFDNADNAAYGPVDYTLYKAGVGACGNNAPVAVADAYTTAEDTTLSVPASGVLANDSDLDRDTLTAVLVAGPASGSVSLNADGSFVYTPAANFNGSVTFTYAASDGLTQTNATVTITVTPVNDPPVAANDAYTTAEDTVLNVPASGVLANDTDVDGDVITAVLVANPAHGTLTLNANGSFTYTPAANYNGADSFTYKAQDPSAAQSNVATVSLTITPVNDPPVAANDAYTTAEDTPLTVSAPGVLTNDTDVDSTTLTAVLGTSTIHGTLTLNTDGSFTYTPVANYNGSDSFTYTVSDGSATSNVATVTITITPVNDPPVANPDSATTHSGVPVTVNVTANDTDVDGNTLTVTSFTQGANGTVTCTASACTYTSTAAFVGSDSFNYTISDGNGGTATATVSVTVLGNFADLSVVATASPEPVTAGTALAYQIVAHNNGPSSTPDLTISEEFSAGTEFRSIEGGFSCVLDGRLLTCTGGGLANGDSTTLIVHVLAPTTTGLAVAEIGVGSTQPDNDSSNNNVRVASNVIAPVPVCPSDSANPSIPANGAIDVANPVTFTWSAVTNAVGYTVMGSIDGAPDQQFGSTDSATTTLAVTLTGSNVSWFVRVNYKDCPSIDSGRVTFQLEAPDTCESHGKATLQAPGDSTTVGSSIDFQWTPVRHANGYRVWAAVNGAPAAALGTTQETTFHAVIPTGSVDWYVESLFPGCPSTESLHGHFTVAASTNCSTAMATLIAPQDGTTVHNQSIDFSWSAVPNAIGYEVYLALNGGTPVLLGSTDTETTLHHDVAAGNLEWFVRTLYNGCPGIDTLPHATFVFDPPPACPTHRPILTSPAENAVGLNSPVDLKWSNVPGASQYKVVYSVNHGDPVTHFTSENHLDSVGIATGAVEWSVEAVATGCPSLISPISTFTVVPPPPPCSTPGETEMRAQANSSSNVEYTVRWDPIPGVAFYELQEATRADFIGASMTTLTETEQTFRHGNDIQGTVAFYYYRVRGVNDCNGGQRGSFSPSVDVGILPPVQADVFNPTGATPVDHPQPTTYQLQICTAAGPNCAFIGSIGQSFTVATDQPWLSVVPSGGTLTAAGVTLNVTAAINGLGVGTNTGTVIVTFSGGSSAAARVRPMDGGSTSSSNVSVNLVAPVANTPKNTPPPDALIIPAVAHADGLSSHFESDIRVSNTSPQPIKYQLTFTPSGDSGIKEGKQTTIDVDPGRTVALDDVLDSWFGAGVSAKGATGALEIRPLTTTASSVSSSALTGLPNIVTFASSRTYSTLAKGSLGTYVPAIPFANFIGKGTNALTLQQVAQTSSFRTNLGLVEGSGQPATVLIKMFGANGQQMGSMTQQLNGGQHLQINQVLATKGLTNVADGRLEISVTSATGKVTAYASVLDNKNNDAQLVSPVALSQSGSPKYVLPGVTDTTSAAGRVQSDVRLFNASTSPVTATLSLHVDGSTDVVSKDVTIGAGQVQELDNVVESLFGKPGAGNAALHITTAAPANLIATAKTYTQLSSGSIGQFISAVTPQQAITASSRPLQLLQVEESNRITTDVGVAEVSGKPVQLEVTIIPQDAKVAAKVQIALGANEFHTMKALLHSAGLDGAYNARVTVKVIGGQGAATAYASTTDRVTNDTTFIPAQ